MQIWRYEMATATSRIEIAMLISIPKARAATPPRIRTRRISSVA